MSQETTTPVPESVTAPSSAEAARLLGGSGGADAAKAKAAELNAQNPMRAQANAAPGYAKTKPSAGQF